MSSRVATKFLSIAIVPLFVMVPPNKPSPAVTEVNVPMLERLAYGSWFHVKTPSPNLILLVLVSKPISPAAKMIFEFAHAAAVALLNCTLIFNLWPPGV